MPAGASLGLTSAGANDVTGAAPGRAAGLGLDGDLHDRR